MKKQTKQIYMSLRSLILLVLFWFISFLSSKSVRFKTSMTHLKPLWMKRKPKKNKTKTSNASGFGAPAVLIFFFLTLKQTRPWYYLQQANVMCTASPKSWCRLPCLTSIQMRLQFHGPGMLNYAEFKTFPAQDINVADPTVLMWIVLIWD